MKPAFGAPVLEQNGATQPVVATVALTATSVHRTEGRGKACYVRWVSVIAWGRIP